MQFVAVFQDAIRKAFAYTVDFHQFFGSCGVDILFGVVFLGVFFIDIRRSSAVFHPFGELKRRGYFVQKTVRHTGYLLELFGRIDILILCAKSLQAVDLLWGKSEYEAFVVCNKIGIERVNGIFFRQGNKSS